MRGYIILAAVLCSTLHALAQDRLPKTAFTRMYLPVWEEAREHCLAVARAMPEDKYQWKPTEVSKTFAEQMVHIAYTIPLLTRRYVLGMDVKPVVPDAAAMSKDEIIAMLEDGFAFTTEVIYEIEQSALDEITVMYHSGNTVSRALALFYVQDHMANHRAKANLYIRMNGIQPPEYTW